MVPFLCGKSCGKREKTRPQNEHIQVQLLWDSQTSAIRFEVTDNGKGVTEAQAHALFESGVAVNSKERKWYWFAGSKTYVVGLAAQLVPSDPRFGSEYRSFKPPKMHPIFLTFQGAEETSFREILHAKPCHVYNKLECFQS